MRFPWKKNAHSLTTNGKEHVTFMPYTCQVYSVTDTGPTRDSNEDNIVCFYPHSHFRTLFVMVADGMGGHEAGEIASSIACRTATEFVNDRADDPDTACMMEQCMQAAQAAILLAAEENRVYNGMGTTATMVFIRDGHMYFAHIGDSRLYHFRNGKLIQQSTDDTLVNQMMKEGKISREEASAHEMKHVLTQALGSVKEIHPQIAGKGTPIEPGDVFFACSDGIYDVLDPNEIESLLKMGSPQLAIECIKSLCIQRKASDNFSAILVDIAAQERSQVPVTKELNSML